MNRISIYSNSISQINKVNSSKTPAGLPSANTASRPPSTLLRSRPSDLLSNSSSSSNHNSRNNNNINPSSNSYQTSSRLTPSHSCNSWLSKPLRPYTTRSYLPRNLELPKKSYVTSSCPAMRTGVPRQTIQINTNGFRLPSLPRPTGSNITKYKPSSSNRSNNNNPNNS